jgi:hypothetical protein
MNYTNNLKLSNESISAKSIKNIFINEVKNLSKLFFHKKFEKINFIRNMDYLNKKNDDSDNSKEQGNLKDSLEIKKMKIKNELIDNIKGKFAKNNTNSDSFENSRFNNYPKSVSIRRKKNRDIKINLKKIISQQKDIKTLINDTPDLSIKSEKDNNPELIIIQENSQQKPINNHNNMSRNKNDVSPKISVETNTDSTLVEKYKIKLGLKDIIEEIENPQLRLYDQYYKYEGKDQLDNKKVTFVKRRRNTRKIMTNIQNNKSENDSELLNYDLNNSNNKRSNKKIITENNINNHRNFIQQFEKNKKIFEFNESENFESNGGTIIEHMEKEKLKNEMNPNEEKKTKIKNNLEKEKNKKIEENSPNKIIPKKMKKRIQNVKNSNKKLNENVNITIMN